MTVGNGFSNPILGNDGVLLRDHVKSADYNGSTSDPLGNPGTTGWLFAAAGALVANVSRIAADQYVAGAVIDPWDISTGAYTGKSLPIGAQETTPQGLAFSPDGLTAFIVGIDSDTIYQYGLTAAFDISTASYSGKSLNVNAQDAYPADITFSPDGLTAFVAGNGNSRIYQYGLTAAFDISTATYSAVNYSVLPEDKRPTGLVFSPDGLTAFVVGTDSTRVFQYGLTAAFDIGTAAYTGASLSVLAQMAGPQGLTLSADGHNLYVVDGGATSSVFQYGMPTAWSLATATYTGKALDVGAQETVASSIQISPDGLTAFIVGFTTTTIYQYTLNPIGNPQFSQAATPGTGISILGPDMVSMVSGALQVIYATAGRPYINYDQIRIQSAGAKTLTIEPDGEITRAI